MEALALAHHASTWARQTTKITGNEVDALALESFEPVQEVEGLTDTWWRGSDSLVAVYAGEAGSLSAPRCRTALIYSGPDEWGLYGGVPDGRHENGL
ncbi:hypothetical protein [Streptomyces sp. NPDC047065]|uniref:hypothetical protein n=1 Tax=Streptomyces sp. NPDC047065 TaxID=3154606 RepID=UPI0033D240FA